MTTEPLYANFSSRRQGHSRAAMNRVELPFKLKRLPPKRDHICTLGYEGMGYWADVRLELAPPVRGRPWWSIYSFVHEESWDGPKHNYAGVPIAYLEATDSDSQTDIAKYLLLVSMNECCIGCHRVTVGLLNSFQIRAIQLTSDCGAEASGDFQDPNLQVKDREAILRHVFPDLLDTASRRLNEYFNAKSS